MSTDFPPNDPDDSHRERGEAFATFATLTNGAEPPDLPAEQAESLGKFLHANGFAYDDPADASLARHQLWHDFGGDYSGQRDLEEILDYPDPDEVSPESYVDRYRSQDIARAVVDAPVGTTWRNSPEIQDTPDEDDDTDSEFEQAVAELLDTTHIQRGLPYYWERADRDCRLGQYSLLFFGFDDGRRADEAVNEAALNEPGDLRFIRPIKQAEVEDWVLAGENDERDPGLPITYDVKVERPDANGSMTYDTKTVHYTRIIHVTDDPDATRLLSTPALEPILRRLIDFEKVLGASAEMYWVGADRKFFFSNDTSGSDSGPLGPGGASATPDYDQLDQHLREMMHGLKPALYADNMDMEVIDGQQIDPTGIIGVLYQSISAVTGIPKRILTGSERGELASSQDEANWFGEISERQEQFAEPVLVRATLDLLVSYGLLPEPQEEDYDIEWPSLYEQDEQEKADTRNADAQAIQRIENAASVSTLPRKFLYEEVLGYEIPEELEDEIDPDPEDLPGAAGTAPGAGAGTGAPQSQDDPAQGGQSAGDGDGQADGPEQPSGDGGTVDETDVNVREQFNVMKRRLDANRVIAATSDD